MTRRWQRRVTRCAVLAAIAFFVSGFTVGKANPSAGMAVSQQWVAPGVLISGSAGLIIHCTNFSPVDADATFDLFNFNGALEASVATPVRAKRTVSVSFSIDGSGSALYREDVLVAAGAAISQGHLRLSWSGMTGSLLCAPQLLEMDTATPTFVVALPLLDLQTAGITGNCGADFIFGDGFESARR